MQLSEIMTRNPTCCTASDTVADVARIMRDRDCGVVPVVSDQQRRRLVGLVTDRDLACRVLAERKGPETQVLEVMSADPSCCALTDDVEDVERVMTERQVRRVPVIDAEGRCVGIVAQADLARRVGAQLGMREVARVIERVSEPSANARREAPVGRQVERPEDGVELS